MFNSIAPMPIIVKNYARKFGVTVRMQGSLAYTNGKTITIPRLDITDPIKARLAYGYLAHESAHVRYTDFSILKRKEFKNNELMFSLFNILEDSRIENLISKEFIGVYENIALLNDYYKKEWMDFVKKANSKPVLNVLLSFIQVYSHCYFQKYECDYSKARQLYFLLKPRFNKLNAVARLVKESTKAKDSLEMFKYCKKIYELISKAEYKSNQSQNDLDTEERNDYLELKTKQVKQDDNCSKGFKAEFVNFNRELNGDRDKATPFKGGASILSEIADNNSSTRDDFGVIDEQETDRGDPNFITKAKEVYALRATIYRKLNAYVELLKERGQSGRKIDIYKAQRLRLGEENIFFRNSVAEDYSTSIQILVDVSSSMLTTDGLNYSRAEYACICALNLALALEGIDGIKSACHFFPGKNNECETALDFNQRASKRAPFFDQRPRGSTPLAQALFLALNKIINANCNRNIIIVLTDGMPDSVSNVKHGFDIAKKMNVEIYGISIRSEFIEKLFENYQVIESPSELNKAVLNLFSKVFDIQKLKVA
ncbi:MAG: hypothetical protein K6G11_08275 [Lachnospiraceae bacterium]|nr:hypothetical protein [Lachnospiraceae bacterium]